jgi:hypothetical protein
VQQRVWQKRRTRQSVGIVFQVDGEIAVLQKHDRTGSEVADKLFREKKALNSSFESS